MSHFDERNPLRDDEWPDEVDDAEGIDEPGFVQCSACGKMIIEDAPQCPYCKTYGPTDGLGELRGRKRLLWIVAVVLVLVVWLLMGRVN